MKRLKWFALLLCAILLLCGCAAKSSYAPAYESARYEGEAAYDMAPASQNGAFEMQLYAAGGDSSAPRPTGGNAAGNANGKQQPSDDAARKIVYTANLSLRADDPAAALAAIIQKAKALGGYVAASSTRNGDDGPYYAEGIIKIPPASLDALVSAAEAAGVVESYSLNSDDISLSYYDIQARLKSATIEETQLLEIMEKCTNVKDLLAVREQVAAVRSDIESYQARINLWDSLVDYATLEVSIRRTPQTAVEGEGTLIELWRASDVWKKITNGFQNSARFMMNFIAALGIFIAAAFIPAAVLFCCVGIPLIMRARRKKRRAAEQAAQQQAAQQPAP